MRDGLIVSDLTEAPAAQDGAISSAEPVLASSFD
jgi:hypothetical protein